MRQVVQALVLGGDVQLPADNDVNLYTITMLINSIVGSKASIQQKQYKEYIVQKLTYLETQGILPRGVFRKSMLAPMPASNYKK